MTHTIHRPPGMTMTKTNTHTKTKTKTKCSKDPTYAIFLKSRGFKDIKYDNMSADQTRPDQTRPDQTREDFNLADLILELSFLFLHSDG